jgi:hypothetical protein
MAVTFQNPNEKMEHRSKGRNIRANSILVVLYSQLQFMKLDREALITY